MDQIDFIGGSQQQARPAKVVRNTRPTVAEEKARLCLDLGRLCLSVPPKIVNGGVIATRKWLAHQKKYRALVANARASVVELEIGVREMRSYIE